MDPQDVILDQYHHPKNFGTLDHPTHRAKAENFSCGDKLSMDIFAENDILKEIRWTGTGCTVSQASASLLSEKVISMRFEDIARIGSTDIIELLGIPLSPVRLKCALLALETLQRALKNPL